MLGKGQCSAVLLDVEGYVRGIYKQISRIHNFEKKNSKNSEFYPEYLLLRIWTVPFSC